MENHVHGTKNSSLSELGNRVTFFNCTYACSQALPNILAALHFYAIFLPRIMTHLTTVINQVLCCPFIQESIINPICLEI